MGYVIEVEQEDSSIEYVKLWHGGNRVDLVRKKEEAEVYSLQLAEHVVDQLVTEYARAMLVRSSEPLSELESSPKKVWAIFSTANEYNQPRNNLVKLFQTKPTIERLLEWYQGYVEEAEGDTKRDRMEQLLNGEEVTFYSYGDYYRLEEVDVV